MAYKSDLLKNNGYLANPDLKWETTITRNIGIDYGFFRGRINGTLDFYWNTTKDLLTKADIPGSSGFTVQYQNFGKTSNKGIELALNASVIEKKNFDLNFNFNVSYNKSKIDKLAGKRNWDTNAASSECVDLVKNFRHRRRWWLRRALGITSIMVSTPSSTRTRTLMANWYSMEQLGLRDGVKDNSWNLTGGRVGSWWNEGQFAMQMETLLRCALATHCQRQQAVSDFDGTSTPRVVTSTSTCSSTTLWVADC